MLELRLDRQVINRSWRKLKDCSRLAKQGIWHIHWLKKSEYLWQLQSSLHQPQVFPTLGSPCYVPHDSAPWPLITRLNMSSWHQHSHLDQTFLNQGLCLISGWQFKQWLRVYIRWSGLRALFNRINLSWMLTHWAFHIFSLGELEYEMV